MPFVQIPSQDMQILYQKKYFPNVTYLTKKKNPFLREEKIQKSIFKKNLYLALPCVSTNDLLLLVGNNE